MTKMRMLGRMGRTSSSFPSAAADDTDASAYLFQHVRSVSETAKAEAVAISNTSNADDPSPLSSSKPSKLMDEKHKLLQQKRPKNTKTRRQKLNTVVRRSVLPKLKKNLAGIITSTRSSNPSSMPTPSASLALSSSSGDVDTSLSTQESSDSAVSGAAAADIILLFDHSDEVEVDDQSFATSGTTGDVTTATGATAQVGNLTNDPGMNVLSAILDVSAVNMSWDDRHGSDDNSCDDDDDDLDDDFDDDDDLIIIAGSAVTIDYVYQTSSPTRLPSPTGSMFVPRTANANRERNLNQRQQPTEGGILDRFFDRFSCGGGCGAYSIYDM